MDLLFQSDRLARTCNDSKSLRREFGADGERAIRKRLDDLSAAATLGVVAKLPGAHCEELKGHRAGQLSVRVHGGFRLIFQPAASPAPAKPDGGLDWPAVKAIVILSIEDYHA